MKKEKQANKKLPTVKVKKIVVTLVVSDNK